MIRHFSLCLATALLVTACAAPQQTPAQLNDRIGNAQSISDLGERDKQLMVIAGDAANARNADACLKAVSNISNNDSRDTTAEACADTFDGYGDRKTAEALVDKIYNRSLQDRMRAHYARMAPANGN